MAIVTRATSKIAHICKVAVLLAIFTGVRQGETAAGLLTPGFRPPAVPLAVVDPYFSIWSMADNLYDDSPRHWLGTVISLAGMIRIDGQVYRFMGKDSDLVEEVAKQVNLTVYPTQTVYTFQQNGVQLTLTFSTPGYTDFALQSGLLYVPITYLTFDVLSMDGNTHSVQLYYDNTAEGAVADVSEEVVWNRVSVSNQLVMRIGSNAQNYLGQGSDRINWGYWYVALPNQPGILTAMANTTATRAAFLSDGKQRLWPPDDTNQPRKCSDNWPGLALIWDLGNISPGMSASRYLTLLYDQVFSIRYFGTAMAPYWRHLYNNDVTKFVAMWNGPDTYTAAVKSCQAADNRVTSEVYSVGGSNYTTICSLAWRQTFGGLVSVWNNVTQEKWLFMKEISSDGDVSTVDVIFPSSPLLYYSALPLMKPLLLPILDYANNETAKYGLYTPYNLSWAPHHLGHWPVCDLPASKQENMPMEESGNMLILLAAVVYMDKEHDISFLQSYWPLLQTWADYNIASLPDPGDQLCTDDFEGPSPHNVNLAAKGIVSVGAYTYLLELDGQKTLADHYNLLNANFTLTWLKKAYDNGHYKLQYNLTNTWSLKYNILYQKVLHLDLFPDFVIEQEEGFYQSMMNPYGVPLDDRATFTKTDWEMWVAAMGNSEQFKAITDKVYRFANETPDRVPFTDWYETLTGRLRGFRARPVIGGLFARMLIAASEKE